MNFNRILALPALLALGLSSQITARADNESLTAIFTNASAHHVASPNRTSIIFIAWHGLGVGDLSCYGQTNFQTPNFDRLAKEGARFTHYQVPGDDLSQAQSALMAADTGATLATKLQQAGYATTLLGEWTLGQQPWTQGFDEFDGFTSEQDAKNYYPESFWHYIPRRVYAAEGEPPHDALVRQVLRENGGGQKSWFLPDGLMTMAGRVIHTHQPDAGNHFKPFFLLLNLPFPESLTPGKDDYPMPTDAPFGGENWPAAAKNRAALLTRLDNNLGNLLQQLGSLGLTNNTAIFLAGAAAPEPFADTNMDFLKLKDEIRGGSSEGRLRAPLIVYWPGHMPAGRVDTAACNTADLAATILQMAGKPVAGGTSLVPRLISQPATRAR